MTGESEEFATIDALMTALYASISGPTGGQDFELARRIFHPDLRLVRTRLDEAGFTPRQVADQLGHANPSMTLDVYFGRQVVSAEAARVPGR